MDYTITEDQAKQLWGAIAKVDGVASAMFNLDPSDFTNSREAVYADFGEILNNSNDELQRVFGEITNQQHKH